MYHGIDPEKVFVLARTRATTMEKVTGVAVSELMIARDMGSYLSAAIEITLFLCFPRIATREDFLGRLCTISSLLTNARVERPNAEAVGAPLSRSHPALTRSQGSPCVLGCFAAVKTAT